MHLRQLPLELRRRQKDARFLAHEVIRHFVPVGDDAPHEVWMALRPLPDKEERRPGTVTAQDTQQLRSRCRIGPVVDGDSYVLLTSGDGREDLCAADPSSQPC
jgi:hypothetical protein